MFSFLHSLATEDPINWVELKDCLVLSFRNC